MSKPDLREFVANLLEKHASGTCTPQEAQFLHDWYNNIEASFDAPLDDAARETIRQRLWSKINPEKGSPRRHSWLYKVAAMIILPMAAVIAFYAINRSALPVSVSSLEPKVRATRSETSIFNGDEEARRITLADGSIVTLQTKTEIRYAVGFDDTVREVYLKGEAFFDITHDPQRPFVVYANEVVTKVLGTSFSIRAYEKDQEVTVSVKTGRVSVYVNPVSASVDHVRQPEMILTPNQKMVYDRHREVASKQLVEEPEIVLPQSTLFAMEFENARVSEIFRVLTKNYGVEIRFDEKLLNNCRLTTSMSDEGLYERIEVICKAIGASYFVKDATIIITSKGC